MHCLCLILIPLPVTQLQGAPDGGPALDQRCVPVRAAAAALESITATDAKAMEQHFMNKQS